MTKIVRAGEDITERPDSPTASTAVSHAQHTSVPWRVVDRPSRGLQIEWGGSEDGIERPVAHMRWTDGMRPEVEARVAADAKFLVRAVNNHEALLAALKELLRQNAVQRAAYSTDIGLATAADHAASAIAKAEGK